MLPWALEAVMDSPATVVTLVAAGGAAKMKSAVAGVVVARGVAAVCDSFETPAVHTNPAQTLGEEEQPTTTCGAASFQSC
jgi:hypothetical protein